MTNKEVNLSQQTLSQLNQRDLRQEVSVFILVKKPYNHFATQHISMVTNYLHSNLFKINYSGIALA